jgi:Cys-rich repeat protein
MRSFRRLALVLSALAGLSQLACSVPEGRFACTTNSDCPSGFVCRANGRCHSTPDDPTTDAALPSDAGVLDAWRDDAPGLDAFEGPLDAARDDAPGLDAPGLDAFEIDAASEDAPAVDAFSPDDAPLDASRSDAPTPDAGPGAACGGVTETCADTVAAGGFSTCAIRADGVHCWGLDENGVLGNSMGTTGCPNDVEGRDCRNSPALVSDPSARLAGVRAIEGGERTFCALVADMTPVCWGTNITAMGAAGFAEITGIRGMRGSRQISLRYPIAFVISSAFVVGEDHEGAGVFGIGGTPPAAGARLAVNLTSPLPPSPLLVEAGWNHVCAIDDASNVWCWGKNVSGELGNGMTSNSTSPVAVSELTSETDAIGLALADASSCALTSTGRVVCWGSNAHGELGRGAPAGPTAPVLRDDTEAPLVNIVQIDAGFWHVCARDNRGGVWCWGNDERGQVGDGSMPDVFCGGARCVTRARRVVGLDDAVDLSCGTMHSCALRANGEVVCWGDNQFGELGDGSFADSNVPVAVGF